MKERLTVQQITNFLEKMASSRLSYSWDNVGLLVGEGNAEVSKILLTLDITPRVIDYSIAAKADLIISHHPLFFSPLKKINDPDLLRLIKNGIAVYCMHTNLDVIDRGVSHAAASLIGVETKGFLSEHSDLKTYHIAVYVPEESVDQVSKAVFDAGAGVIGNYDHCLNSYPVSGQFKPLAGSNPTIGQSGTVECVNETKIEFFADSFIISQILTAMHLAHPYETPAYAVYPVEQKSLNYGLGITGSLKQEMSLQQFAEMVRDKLQAPFVKLWPADKSPQTMIKKIALCGGSGSSEIRNAERKADVFVSSDFTYHKILESKIPLIDAGHFFTEFPILAHLKEKLTEFKVEIETYEIEKADIQKLVII
jgi:dinuclear metal center YbgI/SA1388 family protein